MIKITDKSDCCGCKACIQICPQKCISMFEDEEGFLYPQVNQEKCIDCGLCEKVCPVLNQYLPRKPLKVYAAKNENEKIRMESSSGGVFTLLAESVINRNGVVFGAKFDEKWKVVHGYTETIEGLADFRGSKYVQSDMGNCFNETREFLKKGRQVLFTGTPCQIAGLKLFLRKEYENLLVVDIICHGVPSPMVWRDYLKEKTAKINEKQKFPFTIKSISFRNKEVGWENFSFKIEGYTFKKKIEISEIFRENVFMRGFLKNIFLRPSCYNCPSRKNKSRSDLTLGDFWGVGNVLPEIDDDKGISLVIVNSNKGQIIYDKLDKESTNVSYSSILKYNPVLEFSVNEPKNRFSFYKSKSKNTSKKIRKSIQDDFSKRTRFFYKRIKDKIILKVKRVLKKS